jgi:hypothetical protein
MKELSIEEKELLLKDLCARLPYDPIVYVDEKLPRLKLGSSTRVWEYIAVDKPCKPYLRSMSSMTEKERSELSKLTNDKFKFYLYTTKPEIICYEKYNYIEGLKVLDWLNAHHFDYRGLIEKGLALEAPKEMYDNEQNK